MFNSNVKQMETKVGEFDSVLKSIDGHIIKTDKDLNIEFINKDIFGISTMNIIGTSFKKMKIYNPTNIKKLLDTKTTVKYKSKLVIDSNTFLFLVTASPIFVQNEVVGITILCTDLTYELELKKKDIEHEKQLYALKSKSEFIASISHEIRNPLQALTFSIENLMADPRTDQIVLMKEAKHSNQVINMIIGDILDSSKIESGKLQLQEKYFDTLETIESAFRINIPQSYKKGLSFDYAIDFEHIPARIFGDSQRLVQILSNFISNAIKYTMKGGIDIHVKNIINNDKKYLHFSIKDTGIGIKQEKINQLFTMFEQVHDSNEIQSKGWGIGLSIVKGLIDLMGGKYGVESEHGIGSNFWFEIPYKTDENPQTLMESFPQSLISTVVLTCDNVKSAYELMRMMQAMKVENIHKEKNTQSISDIYLHDTNCKIFVSDEHVNLLPPNIPHEKVTIVGNSSKKNSEYNDCSRLFQPILPSDLIQEITKNVEKRFSAPEQLLNGLNVLIVEDHIVIQKSLKRFIEKMNPKQVFVASNGEEGLELFIKESNIDLVLTDLNMPKMNGFELIKSIRQLEFGSKTKIIITTGDLNNQQLVDFCCTWTVTETLLKPISFKSLTTSIKNCFITK